MVTHVFHRERVGKDREHGGAEADEHIRAQARRFMFAFSLKPYRRTQDGSDQQTGHEHRQELHLRLRKQVVHQLPHRVPLFALDSIRYSVRLLSDFVDYTALFAAYGERGDGVHLLGMGSNHPRDRVAIEGDDVIAPCERECEFLFTRAMAALVPSAAEWNSRPL